MNKKFFIVLVGSIFMTNNAMAASPFEKYLKKIAILENEDGHKLKTFEDVDGVVLNPLQKKNKPYPIVAESEIPEGYVKKDKATKYFKQLTSNALIVDENPSFNDFIAEHMTFESDGFAYNDIPANTGAFSDPGNYTFVLRVDDNYRYVKSFREYPPDALSCRVAPELCGEKCKIKTVKNKENGESSRRRRRYFDGSDYGSAYATNYLPEGYGEKSTTTKKVHVNGPNNIYSDFKANITSRAEIEEAKAIRIEDAVVIEAEDRTPPCIKDGYELLGGDIGSLDVCTSGDWYKSRDLEVADNYNGRNAIFGKFAFGRLGMALPNDGDKWEELEDWTYKENVKYIDVTKQKIKYYQYTNQKNVKNGFSDIVKFPDFDGVIRYSIFLKEASEDGNTNPGVDKVIDDSPEIGYGYKIAGDLGRDPFNAKPWPDRRNLEDIAEKGQDTAYVRVCDNDRPNIVIRVTETETGKQMFFPPCLPAGEFPVKKSAVYKPISGLNKGNQDDYDLFVSKLTSEYDYSLISKNPDGIPYYTIYGLNGYEDKENTGLWSNSASRMLKNQDLKFINQNVRLEDYAFSDTDSEGKITYSFKNDELGKKLGTTASMTILFENSGTFVFKPDVEYVLDVWTDDNVKWTNIKTMNLENPVITHDAYGNIMGVNMPEVLELATVYATGIKEGVIRVKIPDERENLSHEKEIDISKSINGGIRFVLKNATQSGKRVFDSIADIEALEFPYIEVFAKDFAGFTRSIKMFFRVGDKNLNIRTLD